MPLNTVPKHLEEPFPIRRERADAAARAVRGNEQCVDPEQRLPLRLDRGKGSRVRFRLSLKPQPSTTQGTPGFFNSMTTSGRPLTKPTVGNPNCEVQSVRQSKFVIRVPVTLNWLTSRKSLFAGCSQSPATAPSSARRFWNELHQRLGTPIPRSASLSSNSVEVEFTTNTSVGSMVNNPAGCWESVTINTSVAGCLLRPAL